MFWTGARHLFKTAMMMYSKLSLFIPLLLMLPCAALASSASDVVSAHGCSQGVCHAVHRQDIDAVPTLEDESLMYVSAGTVHSIQGVGFCAEFGRRDFHSFALTADLLDILNGNASTPGLKFTYHYNMQFLSKQTRSGYSYCIYAGPGLAQGYVRSLDGHLGYMSGISGDVGGRVLLGRSVALSIEFQGDIALIFKNRYISNMSLYTSGLRHSYIPYLRIQYSF